MDLYTQICAARGEVRANKRGRIDWGDVKSRLRAALTDTPKSRKDVIAAAKITADQFDKVIRELVAAKAVDAVYPGEFGRRAFYVKHRGG